MEHNHRPQNSRNYIIAGILAAAICTVVYAKIDRKAFKRSMWDEGITIAQCQEANDANFDSLGIDPNTYDVWSRGRAIKYLNRLGDQRQRDFHINRLVGKKELVRDAARAIDPQFTWAQIRVDWPTETYIIIPWAADAADYDWKVVKTLKPVEPNEPEEE